MRKYALYIGLALVALAVYVWWRLKPSQALYNDVRGKWGNEINAAARGMGLPPRVVAAMVAVESSGIETKTGLMGERGLMQLKQSTFEDMRKLYNLGTTWDDMYTGAKNLPAGSQYLAWIRDNYFSDQDEMVRAYNVGVGWLHKFPLAGLLYLYRVKNYLKLV